MNETIKKPKKIKRAVSVNELYNKNYKTVPFEGVWKNSIGEPEIRGSWIISGNPSNGKTSFALQLLKYFAQLGFRCAYDSLEEGASYSMKLAFKRVGMVDVKSRVILLDKEPISELKKRLRLRKSPDIIAIDSIQYTGMTYKEYKDLQDEFRNKLFIYISHAKGKNPAGGVAESIRFDAFVKIWVEAYIAHPQSRYGGGDPFVIWEEGANQI